MSVRETESESVSEAEMLAGQALAVARLRWVAYRQDQTMEARAVLVSDI